MNKRTSPKRDYARTVCDQLTRDGTPDMYNYVAKRPVTKEEAESHGWHMFYDGVTECSRGHIAARYVINPAMCSDCNRENNGKVAIYPNSGGDLTAPVPSTYVEPIANSKFTWTREIEDQFFTAYVNSADVERALQAIKAQFSHLLDHLGGDAEFKARFEREKAEKVAQVQLWKTESIGVSGSERAALSMFAPIRVKNELGARNVRTPEQISARIAARLQRLIGASGHSLENRAGAPSATPSVPEPQPRDADPGEDRVGSGSGRRGTVAPDDPNRDLVS